MRRRVFSGIRLGKIGARAGGVWARQGYLPTRGNRSPCLEELTQVEPSGEKMRHRQRQRERTRGLGRQSERQRNVLEERLQKVDLRDKRKMIVQTERERKKLG